MKITILLAVAFCVALLAASLSAENDQQIPAKEPSIEEILLGKDFASMQNLKTSLIQQRESTIEALVAAFDKSVDKANNTFLGEGGPLAALLLGEMRAETAVSPLADGIELRGLTTINGRTLQSMYPCYGALVRIGKPASLECLKRLASEKFTESDKGRLSRSELLLKVVREVEGDDVARFMLQNAIDKEQDKDKKANLTAALALLEKRIKEEAEILKQHQEQNSPPAPPSDNGTTPAPGP
jgi:hypothetical protein